MPAAIRGASHGAGVHQGGGGLPGTGARWIRHVRLIGRLCMKRQRWSSPMFFSCTQFNAARGACVAALLVLACSTPAQAVTNTTFDTTLGHIEQLANLPDPDADLLTIKLAIDALVAPASDLPRTRPHIDALHTTIANRILPGASNDTKLERLLDTLYTPSP